MWNRFQEISKTKQMNKFDIREGEVWAGNFFRRHWHRVSGLTTDDRFTWRISLDMSEVPAGTTIKLCGVATASPFRYERVKKGGWGQLFSFSHEDSDRVIATSKPDGRIALKTYAYRDGEGPSTTGESFSSKICEVKDREPFQLRIDHLGGLTKYIVQDMVGDTYINDMKRPGSSQSFLKHRTFAHAKGYKQESSPGRIEILAEVT